MVKTGKSMSILLLILFSVLTIPFHSLQAADKGGVVSGKLVDAETGESVIGAAVQVDGTTIGCTSDIDGNFIIRNVPVGQQTLIVQCIGYAKTRIEELKIVKGESTEINLSLTRKVLDAGIIVEVTAEALQNNEASLLRERQLSNVVSDAISAEAISRSGSGDAASAIKKVTGVSVVGGKYVFVRGLGDRYVNTKLNGSALPSADPEKQAFPMDMIPAGLLDKIVVKKAFTPDMSADFAGGSVNIGTKELPGRRVLEFSSSLGYNSQVNLNNDFLTYSGGNPSFLWLGDDQAHRELPGLISDLSIEIPTPNAARRDSTKALFLDEVSKAFSDEMAPSRHQAPLDQSYKLSYGDVYSVWDRNLSLIASLSYKRSFSYYENGTVARWDRAAANVMDDQLNLSDTQGKDEVLWGGMVNLRLPLSTRNKLVLDYMYTRSSEDESRYMVGRFDEALAEESMWETRVLRFVERGTGSLQLSGEHKLGAQDNSMQLDWHISGADVSQDEPDLRYFSNDYRELIFGDFVDTTYNIQRNQYRIPTRIWRGLTESNREGMVNFSVPFRQWSGRPAKVKLGSGFMRKKRDFWERRFQIERDQGSLYWGDVNAYVADSSMGIKEVRNGQYIFNNYIFENDDANSAYNSWQEIASAYLMVELPLLERLQAVTGARYERTLMQTTGADRTGSISEKDLLPALGLVYKLTDRINLRASYGKTLARPSLREFAPFSSSSYSQGYLFVGNTELRRSLIDNYDLRFEIFPRTGELAAVSFFVREFEDPIEQAMYNSNNWVQFQNTDKASMYGAEFELRRRLDLLPGEFRNLYFSGNLTLLHTEVRIPALDLAVRRFYDPEAPDTRAMQGQPEYMLNTNLEYSNA
ncbi:MAG: TonB-dependent receptor, partial [bacterium]